MIEVHGLRKSYGPVEAVRGIDLTVDAGEIVAFLGPNGAGKTTTLHTTGSGFAWGDLAVVALWAVVGARVAVRRFRWDPVGPRSRGREREPDVRAATG